MVSSFKFCFFDLDFSSFLLSIILGLLFRSLSDFLDVLDHELFRINISI